MCKENQVITLASGVVALNQFQGLVILNRYPLPVANGSSWNRWRVYLTAACKGDSSAVRALNMAGHYSNAAGSPAVAIYRASPDQATGDEFEGLTEDCFDPSGTGIVGNPSLPGSFYGGRLVADVTEPYLSAMFFSNAPTAGLNFAYAIRCVAI